MLKMYITTFILTLENIIGIIDFNLFKKIVVILLVTKDGYYLKKCKNQKILKTKYEILKTPLIRLERRI